MPEMSTLNGKSKVPMLPSQGASYAKWGRWVDAASSCLLTLKGLHLFMALELSMPVEFPEDEDEDEGESDDEESKDAKPNLELLNVLALQNKVANKYEFAAKSAEAYPLLYEAATHNVQIQRVMKKHKSNFPLAFAGVSHYVTGNLKTAAREIRKELLAEIRKCADARAVREVITFVDANNDDLKLLGTDDELKNNDLFEELMDVLKRVSSLSNVYHLARMPDTQIGGWESLTVYLVDIIAQDSTPTRTPRSTTRSLFTTTVVEADVAGEADMADVTDVEDVVAVAATTAAVVARGTWSAGAASESTTAPQMCATARSAARTTTLPNTTTSTRTCRSAAQLAVPRLWRPPQLSLTRQGTSSASWRASRRRRRHLSSHRSR